MSRSKVIGFVAIVALAVAGFAVWNASRSASSAATEKPRTIERPEPAPPAQKTPEQSPDAGRVEVPAAAVASDPAAALAPGRARGEIGVAHGAAFPAQFELLVDSPGVPQKVFVFPGAERLVTLDLPPGRSVLAARAEGLASRQLVLERAADAPVPPFKLLLEPAGRLNGTVLDARGAPLAGLGVALAATTSKDVWTAASASDGSYAFADVPAGTYRVAFGSADGSIAPVVPIEVGANEAREVPPQRMPELGEAEIQVLDRASQPVPGARVFGAGQAGGWVDGVSDVRGVVRARFLPAGTFYLEVTAEDGRTGQGPLEIHVGRIGRANIHIR